MSSESWWSISGETTGERIRNGLPQLLILSVVVWLGTLVTYNVLAFVIDPITATIAVLVLALAVGLKLRAWLVGDSDESTVETEEITDEGLDEERVDS